MRVRFSGTERLTLRCWFWDCAGFLAHIMGVFEFFWKFVKVFKNMIVKLFFSDLKLSLCAKLLVQISCLYECPLSWLLCKSLPSFTFSFYVSSDWFWYWLKPSSHVHTPTLHRHQSHNFMGIACIFNWQHANGFWSKLFICLSHSLDSTGDKAFWRSRFRMRWKEENFDTLRPLRLVFPLIISLNWSYMVIFPFCICFTSNKGEKGL